MTVHLAPYAKECLVATTTERVAVLKAIKGRTLKKATEPDGFPSEISRNIPILIWVVARLANLIYATGIFPRLLGRLRLVPIVKPGKGPHQVSSKGPIALLSTTVKIIEAVMHHRLLPPVEPQLGDAQYA